MNRLILGILLFTSTPALAGPLLMRCAYPADPTSSVVFTQTGLEKATIEYVISSKPSGIYAVTYSLNGTDEKTDEYLVELEGSSDQLKIEFVRNSTAGSGVLRKGPVEGSGVDLDCTRNRPEFRSF